MNHELEPVPTAKDFYRIAVEFNADLVQREFESILAKISTAASRGDYSVIIPSIFNKNVDRLVELGFTIRRIDHKGDGIVRIGWSMTSKPNIAL